MPITKAFILEDDDFKVIEQKAREMGDASASAALRSIIREWAATQSNPPVASVPRPFPTPANRPSAMIVGG